MALKVTISVKSCDVKIDNPHSTIAANANNNTTFCNSAQASTTFSSYFSVITATRRVSVSPNYKAHLCFHCGKHQIVCTTNNR